MEQGKIDESDLVGSISSFSYSLSKTSSELSSLESDSFDEVTSPPSSYSSSSNYNYKLGADPLSDMSCLIQQLPIKRGLSKYYQGKAQSFTSIAKVNSLEDLIKPEKPNNKKLKSCRSYGGRLMDEIQEKCTPSDNFMCIRPPISPHRSTSTNTNSNQNALFV